MLRIYHILGIVALLLFGLADYRGWAPGTVDEQEQAESQDRDRNSIRNRSYRGGK